MKTNIIRTVDLAEGRQEQYPYPQWSADEENTLRRWYGTLGIKQCSDLWQRLSGRIRSISQIDNKARSMGIQDEIPNDWFELFDEEK